jgi:hypothetical protein
MSAARGWCARVEFRLCGSGKHHGKGLGKAYRDRAQVYAADR